MSLINGYALFNPHLTLGVDWFGDQTRFEATNPEWAKWKPNKPTSPHWYELRHLERLVAACITLDRDRGSDRTVAEFVQDFDGLTGSAKRKVVLAQAGLTRANLSELASNDGMRSDIIERLLRAMQEHTKVVSPKRLGVIGKDHLAIRLKELSGDPEKLEYGKKARVDDGIPFVLESAFVYLGKDAPDRRHIFAGANWSPGIKNLFRSFGQTGEGVRSGSKRTESWRPRADYLSAAPGPSPCSIYRPR